MILREYAADIEANNLLNENSIDYTTIPYKLKDDFKIHCIGLVDLHSDEEILLEGDDCVERFREILKTCSRIVMHNGINYDLLALKLHSGVEYTVADDEFGQDIIDGNPITIEDTMVMSKVLNPDRWKGHSLNSWGERLKFPKTDWRAEAAELGLIKKNDPKGAEFRVYHPRMGEYCLQDCRVTKKTLSLLKYEWGTWNWESAYATEKKVIEICTRTEHRGFWFDTDLARQNITTCDRILEAHRSLIEPLLPTKAITKTALKAGTMNPTPFLKDDVSSAPKNQFKRCGNPTAALLKWVAKHDGEISGELFNFHVKFPGLDSMELPTEHEFRVKGDPDANAFKFVAKHDGTLIQADNGDWIAKMYDKEWTLPILEPVVPLSVPATMADQTHIKNWLVGLGWVPHSWSEKDLTLDSKKRKLTEEKFEVAVNKYVDQTLETYFGKYRLEKVKMTKHSIRDRMLNHPMDKPLKVLTNPDFTIGQEKEVCPGLASIAEFQYGQQMSEYLTYKHRRNMILGEGAAAYDADEDMQKGLLGQDRLFIDHRISTPADTCGCNTSRFKHRKVANVPRTSSLFGGEMRAMFGCDPNTYQLGYDADSLEAMIEAHYCTKYDPTGEYIQSLIQPKPHDCHTVLALYLTDLLGTDFPRISAKSVKYACAYGCTPYRLSVDNGWDMQTAEIVYEAYWEKAAPLARLKKQLEKYWKEIGKKKFILGLDGRKIPVRSQHSLVNALFQSAGVICMKRAMITHESELRERGLIADFFKDDWTKQSYVQQMIAYHDEAQEEISKDLVKFYMFKTKDEAKEFELDGFFLGDVQEAPDGRFFRAYCVSGDLANKSLTDASTYYNLNITLTAGYVIGKNWKDCH